VDEDRKFSWFNKPLGVLGVARGTGVRGRESSCCASRVFAGRDGQANLMQVFFRTPSVFASSRVGFGDESIGAFSSGFGLAAQANEMHRFFIGASVAVGGARGTNPTLGNRGLGELVRAGVVMAVPQVEARLVLLVMDGRRRGMRYASDS